MPPLFSARITVNQSLIDNLRLMPRRVQQNLRHKLQTELKPELQADVNELMEQGPSPVSSPFAFGTPKSRDYYFWMIRNNPDLTDGRHWLRDGTIEHGFDVQISDRLRMSLILIRDIQPKARYVLGPWAVAGHIATGWPAQVEVVRQLIREKAVERVVFMAREALRETVREL